MSDEMHTRPWIYLRWDPNRESYDEFSRRLTETAGRPNDEQLRHIANLLGLTRRTSRDEGGRRPTRTTRDGSSTSGGANV